MRSYPYPYTILSIDFCHSSFLHIICKMWSCKFSALVSSTQPSLLKEQRTSPYQSAGKDRDPTISSHDHFIASKIKLRLASCVDVDPLEQFMSTRFGRCWISIGQVIRGDHGRYPILARDWLKDRSNPRQTMSCRHPTSWSISSHHFDSQQNQVAATCSSNSWAQDLGVVGHWPGDGRYPILAKSIRVKVWHMSTHMWDWSNLGLPNLGLIYLSPREAATDLPCLLLRYKGYLV